MRIFAFGCSITQYFYPTWADMIIHDFKEKYDADGYNWGKSGAGNQFIATRIWEADAIYNFSKDDVILIQWTSMFREDRYHEDHGWFCAGGFSNERLKGKAFKLNGFEYEDELQWADFLHCVMRDCAIISSTKKALDAVGCKTITTSFRDFFEGYEEFDEFESKTLLTYDNLGKILDIYKDKIKLDLLPILNFLDFGTDQKFFNSRPISVPALDEKYKEHFLPEIHPLPFEHKQFVEEAVYPFLNEKELAHKTEEFIQEYNTKIKNKNPIVLSELGWANTYQMGFSDDGWRP